MMKRGGAEGGSMTRVETVEWRRQRRSTGRRSVRGNWTWGMAALVVTATATMAVVWQKVRFQGVALHHNKLVEKHERLVSDLEAERFEFQRRATRATLIPKAAKLGLTNVPTEDLLLVAFDGVPPPANPILDGFVGEALASSGARDGR